MYSSVPLGRFASAALAVWFIDNLFGHVSFSGIPKFYSDTCFRYFGCNPGSYGLDAYVHLIFGVALVFSILWFMHRYPAYSLLGENHRKNFLILLALSALVAVSWEIFEFCSDKFRMVLLNQDLISSGRLAQPSNADTIGDMFFQLLGASATYAALALIGRKD